MYNNNITVNIYIIASITFPVLFPPKTSANEGSCWPSRSLWSKQNAKVSALALSWNQIFRVSLGWGSVLSLGEMGQFLGYLPGLSEVLSSSIFGEMGIDGSEKPAGP